MIIHQNWIKIHKTSRKHVKDIAVYLCEGALVIMVDVRLYYKKKNKRREWTFNNWWILGHNWTCPGTQSLVKFLFVYFIFSARVPSMSDQYILLNIVETFYNSYKATSDIFSNSFLFFVTRCGHFMSRLIVSNENTFTLTLCHLLILLTLTLTPTQSYSVNPWESFRLVVIHR